MFFRPELAAFENSDTFGLVRKGDEIELTVSGLSAEGMGLCIEGDLHVSCPGVFPGERVRVHIDHVAPRTKMAFAHLQELLDAHPARRTPPCRAHESHAGSCTGCPLMALEETAQRAAKRELLHKLYGLEVAEVKSVGPLLGYRWSSKRIAFLGRLGLTLGSYTRGTHVPAPMPHCQVDHPLIVAAFAEVEREARALGIRAYDEAKHEGDLRHVWAKTNGGDVSITLVTCDEQSDAARLLPAKLSAAQVAVSVLGDRTNAMRGSTARVQKGASDLPLSIGDVAVSIGALGFLQPNPEVIANAYEELTAFAGEQTELAFDLYAGAGITTERLRRVFREVVPCEAYEESALALGVTPTASEVFLRKWREEQRRVPDLIVANPPRKGLQKEVCDELLALEAPQLAIMSCGPKGLSEDLARLSARYEIRSMSAYDTLPQTPHVELVVKLALHA